MNTWKNAASLLKEGMVSELFKWGRNETELLVERSVESQTVIHNLLGIELWARIFLRGDSPESLGEELLAMSRTGRFKLEPDYSCVAPAI